MIEHSNALAVPCAGLHFAGSRLPGPTGRCFAVSAWLTVFVALSVWGSARIDAATFPLQASPNGHYLVDQTGAPFLMQADAAWSMIVALTTNEVELYLETRRAQGFNSIIVNLLEHAYVGVDNTFGPPYNRAGQKPFLVGSDYATTNEAYFAYADWVLQRAASKGMFVLLAPCYMGYPGNGSGWYSETVANGVDKCRDYGRFVGRRYRDYPNLAWVMWGDRNADDSTPMVEAIGAGIRETDPNHLMTAHFQRTVSSRDNPVTAPWLTLNAAYPTDIVQPMCLREYRRTPPLPVFVIEAWYENEHGISTAGLRRQVYTALLCGATGHVFGNNPVWWFQRGWQAALSSPAAASLGFVPKVFGSRPWSTLEPDDAHQVVPSSFGAEFYYVAAARATNGSTVMIYVPEGGTIPVDLRRVSGTQAKAYWFNVRDGSVTTIGQYPTTGLVNFPTPSTEDWLLVIDDASRGYGPPGGAQTEIPNISVDAGPDQRLAWPLSGPVQLDGKVYRNGQLTSTGSVSLRWSASGPTPVTFSPSASVGNPSVTLSTEGRYELLLTAWEGTVTNSDSVVIVTASDGVPLPPTSLQIDGQSNPIGLRNSAPRFSWIFSDPDPGDYQGGLRVELFGLSGDLIWDSGRLVAIRSSVDYGGPALTPGASYLWRVTVWDQSGLSRRSTETAWLTMASLSAELLTNPGFETGDTRGWSEAFPGTMMVGAATPYGRNAPHSGSFHAFWMASSIANSSWQRVDLHAYAQAIDANRAWIEATGWLVSDDYRANPPYDQFDFQVRYYNEPGAELAGARYDTGTQNIPNWSQQGLHGTSIPSGARAVEVRFNIWEAGYEAGSADDFSVRVYTVPTPQITLRPLTQNRPDPETGFRLGISSTQPGRYRIESSLNLMDWASVAETDYLGGTNEVVDPSAPAEVNRFYRARRLTP